MKNTFTKSRVAALAASSLLRTTRSRFTLAVKVAALLAVASLAFSHSALAVDITKSNTTTMNTAADWGSTAPVITNLGIFDNTISAVNAAALTLGGNVSLLGLQFNNNLNGPVSIATGSTLTLGASGINMSAANENVTINSLIALQAAQAWNVQTGRTLTTGTNISGNFLLTLNGAGIVNLNGTNSSTVGTTVSAGTVNAGSAGAFGGALGTLTVSGGTVNQSVVNALNSTNRLTVSGGSVNLNQSNSFSGVTTLSGGLTIASVSGAMGTSNVTLSSTGTLRLSNLTAMSSGTLRFDGGTVQLRSDADGAFTTGGVLVVNGAATIDVDSITASNPSRTLTFGSLSLSNNALNVTGGTAATNRYTLGITGTTTLTSNAVVNPTTGDLTLAAISGTNNNSLTKNGAGTLNLTGTNFRATGNTTINTGIVSAQSAQAFAGGAGTVAVSGGVLNQTVANALTATNLLAVSSGTANLSQANNYSGNTTLTSTGVINASASGALGTSNVTLTSGTLQLSNTGAMSTGTLALNGGTLQLRNDANTAFSSGLATVGVAGSTIDVDSIMGGNPSRTLTLGALNIGSQTLSVTGGSTATNRYTLGITGTTTLTGNATFNLTTADLTLAAIAGTTQSLTKNGSGTLNLTGTDSRTTGATTINNGTLAYGINQATTAGGAVTINATTASGAATLDLAGFNSTINSTVTFGGVTAGANALNTLSTGAGTLTLGGNVAYTKATLDANDPGTATLSGNLNLGNATRTFTVANSTLADVDLTVSAVISGGGASGAITKLGVGTLALTSNNTYTGATTITAGTLLVSGTHTVGSGVTGNYAVNSGGTLGGTGTIDLSGTNRSITVVSGGRLQASSVNDLTMLLTSGTLSISGAAASASPSFLFSLDAPNSTVISLTTGVLAIGTGVLEFADFQFTALSGFDNGVYTLFNTSSAITGSLGAALSGSIGGGTGLISLSGGQDLILTVSGVPEPTTGLLAVMGLAFAMAHHRRRRS